jgi:hypothetical protein
MAALFNPIRKRGNLVLASLLVALPLVSGCGGGGGQVEHGVKSPEAQQHEAEMMQKYKQQYQQHPPGGGGGPQRMGGQGAPGGAPGAPR